jgi:hypothetical protein
MGVKEVEHLRCIPRRLAVATTLTVELTGAWLMGSGKEMVPVLEARPPWVLLAREYEASSRTWAPGAVVTVAVSAVCPLRGDGLETDTVHPARGTGGWIM